MKRLTTSNYLAPPLRNGYLSKKRFERVWQSLFMQGRFGSAKASQSSDSACEIEALLPLFLFLFPSALHPVNT
jgi:hypothetical protein